MENTMKNFIILFCLALSPLSFAQSYEDPPAGDDTSNKSSGGYGSGGGGNAAALLAVGAIVYYMRRGNDDESGDESGFGFVRNIRESKFDISFGDNNYFKDDLTNYSYDFSSSSNKFQLNLTYKFN
jgi:hypothetical protein